MKSISTELIGHPTLRLSAKSSKLISNHESIGAVRDSLKSPPRKSHTL